jgi:hypothetical protein
MLFYDGDKSPGCGMEKQNKYNLNRHIKMRVSELLQKGGETHPVALCAPPSFRVPRKEGG